MMVANRRKHIHLDKSKGRNRTPVRFFNSTRIGAAVFVLAGLLFLVLGETYGFSVFNENRANQQESVRILAQKDYSTEELRSFYDAELFFDIDPQSTLKFFESKAFTWNDNGLVFEGFLTDDRNPVSIGFGAYPFLGIESVIQTQENLRLGVSPYGVQIEQMLLDIEDAEPKDSLEALLRDWIERFSFQNITDSTSSDSAHHQIVKNIPEEMEYEFTCGTVVEGDFEYAWFCACYTDEQGRTFLRTAIMSKVNFQIAFNSSVFDVDAADAVVQRMFSEEI